MPFTAGALAVAFGWSGVAVLYLVFGAIGLLGVAGAFDQLLSSSSQAQQRASSEASGLEQRLLQAQGNTVELRRREREAIDPLNRALYDLVTAAEDAATSVQASARIAEERAGLETKLLQLQGNTVALRQRERDALDGTNRALFDQISALEDMQALVEKLRTAASSALAGVEASINAQRDALHNAYDAQIKLIDAQVKSANDAYDAVAKAVKTQRQAAQEAFDAQARSVSTALKALDATEKARAKEYRTAVDQVAAERKAAQNAAPVYAYRWDRGAAVSDWIMRAPHTVEIPFVFHNAANAPLLLGEPNARKYVPVRLLNASFVPAAGSPELNHVPFLPHQIFSLSRSTAIMTMSPSENPDPYPVALLLVNFEPLNLMTDQPVD